MGCSVPPAGPDRAPARCAHPAAVLLLPHDRVQLSEGGARAPGRRGPGPGRPGADAARVGRGGVGRGRIGTLQSQGARQAAHLDHRHSGALVPETRRQLVATGRRGALRPRRATALSVQRRGRAVPLKLLDLARLVYPAFRWARHHEQIALALTAVARGQAPRLLVSIHPQSGKSTLVRLFLSWLLMSDPTRKLLLLSYSKRLAAAHSVAARDMTRTWGPRLFGRDHKIGRASCRARGAV